MLLVLLVVVVMITSSGKAIGLVVLNGGRKVSVFPGIFRARRGGSEERMDLAAQEREKEIERRSESGF